MKSKKADNFISKKSDIKLSVICYNEGKKRELILKMKLKDKIVVVTGVSSGMGKEIARLFLKEGALVAGIDIREDRLEQLKLELMAGDKLITYVGDVSDRVKMDTILDDIIEKNGKLDILVNNAGIMDEMMPVGEVSDGLWNKVMGVNLNGPMYLSRKAVNQMLIQGQGNIINIASVGGLYGSRAGAAYTASKFALVGLTKNIGFMYAKKGIRCNAICPGAVNTDIGAGIKAPSALGIERAMTGLGLNPRTGEPDEIARVALFLASDDSSIINGTVITADTGWTAY